MLDEVWVRSRRTTIHKLEAGGLWLDRRLHAEYMWSQKRCGEELKKDVLSEALGELYSMLGSEVLFGPLNHRFRAKLPFSLSFGFSLSYGLYELSGGREKGEEVAKLGAAFNTGISIFDLIVDNYPELYAKLSDHLNEHKLEEFILGSVSVKQARSNYEEIPEIELQILLRLIEWILSKLRSRLAEYSAPNSTQHHLLALLREAYRYEVASKDADKLPLDEQMFISRRKSRLPFVIIMNLALLHAGVPAKEASEAVESLVEHLSSSFWLLDDMSDLVGDLRSGDLNSILLQVEPSQEDQYAKLTHLLDGKYIDESAEKICYHATNCKNILHLDTFRKTVAEQFYEFYLANIRAWIL